MQQNTLEAPVAGSAASQGQLISDLSHQVIASNTGSGYRHRASLLSLLVSGQGSLIIFNPSEIAYVQEVFADPRQERQLRKELKLVLHAGLTGVLSLRQEGLPILAEQARFLHTIEADFVLKRMEGDLLYCSPDLADLHSLASHVRDRFLSACSDAGRSLSSNQAHLDLIYLTAHELLP